jgi:hypothetical protein
MASVTPPATHLVAGHTYRARLRHQNAAGHWSHWSTPLEFSAGAALPGNLATDLVITEIMYNPPEGSNLEYIELRNISASGPLDLTGVQFTTGIVWTFPDGATLAPGGYLLAVRNRAAFEANYGNGRPIVGEYLTTSLDNGGETLTLSLGPSQPLRVIPFDDAAPWPTGPDGSGASLALIAPETNPDHGLAANWRAGTASPGATDATTYAAWKIARGLTNDGDPDGDGIPNFIEYALAGDPSANDRRILPVFTRNGDNSFTVTMTRALLADDVGWELQQSPELMDWQSIPGVSLQARSATATTETLTLAIPALLPAPGTRFFRFRFNGR